jgi:hypothetical protein
MTSLRDKLPVAVQGILARIDTCKKEMQREKKHYPPHFLFPLVKILWKDVALIRTWCRHQGASRHPEVAEVDHALFLVNFSRDLLGLIQRTPVSSSSPKA